MAGNYADLLLGVKGEMDFDGYTEAHKPTVPRVWGCPKSEATRRPPLPKRGRAFYRRRWRRAE